MCECSNSKGICVCGWVSLVMANVVHVNFEVFCLNCVLVYCFICMFSFAVFRRNNKEWCVMCVVCEGEEAEPGNWTEQLHWTAQHVGRPETGQCCVISLTGNTHWQPDFLWARPYVIIECAVMTRRLIFVTDNDFILVLYYIDNIFNVQLYTLNLWQLHIVKLSLIAIYLFIYLFLWFSTVIPSCH